MPETNRLSEPTEWIDLEFVERQRTPEFAIQVGIQLHLAGLSLSNTKQHLERLGVELSMVEWSDPPSTPAAIADAIEWLDPWVPWVRCLLEAPPAVDDHEERGVVVTFGGPTAVDVATGTQSTLAV